MRKHAKLLILLIASVGLSAGWKTASELETFVQSQGGTWIAAVQDSRSSRMIYGKGSRESIPMLSEAQRILRDNSSLLQIADPGDWEVARVDRSGFGTHFRFHQKYQGFVVQGSEVSMHFNREGQLFAVTSKAPRISGRLKLKSTPREAEDALHRIYGQAARIHIENPVVVSFRPARLAWPALVESQDPADGAWQVLLDAADVRIILSQNPAHLTFDGTASVWKENPFTTPDRIQSKITYLDNSGALEGNFSKTLNANFEHDVTQPIALPDYTTARNAGRRFIYTPEDARAVEAMAYYHISVVQDHYKSMGFPGFGGRAPIFVNVAATDGGRGFDNAFYSASSQFPKTGIYVFGAGDERGNTAMDADVLYHEYSHGVLDRISPSLLHTPLESVYGFSIHEAFGDVAAAAINGNPMIGEFAFRSTSSGAYEGRDLQNTRRFPQNVIWPEIKMSEPHYASLILSGAWWDLQRLIGSGPAHKLFFEAAYLVPPDADFFDYRDALLAADLSSGGEHQNHILQAFAKHGIRGPSQAGKGNVQVQRALMRNDTAVASEFSRGQIIYFALEYSAGGVAPGYFFVPEDIQFNQPSGSNATLKPSLPEIFNGQHPGLNGAVLMEVLTNSSTLPGSYSITFSARRGSTNTVLGRYSVSFTLR